MGLQKTQQNNNLKTVPDRKGGSLKSKILSSSGFALLTMFIWELVEEGIENLIAVAISSAMAVFVTKAISTLAIITATQGIKTILKRFFKPIVKRLTYKEGNDKVNKIKQFFTWIFANKKTLLGTVATAVATLSGTGVIDVNALPCLVVGTLNITPIIYYVALAIFALIGVTGKGFEKIKTFFDRVNAIKADKEHKAIVKEAEKELAVEQKLANQTQAEQERQAQIEQAKKAKEEADAKAEAEHRAKVEEAKRQLLAQQEAVKKEG